MTLLAWIFLGVIVLIIVACLLILSDRFGCANAIGSMLLLFVSICILVGLFWLIGNIFWLIGNLM